MDQTNHNRPVAVVDPQVEAVPIADAAADAGPEKNSTPDSPTSSSPRTAQPLRTAVAENVNIAMLVEVEAVVANNATAVEEARLSSALWTTAIAADNRRTATL